MESQYLFYILNFCQQVQGISHKYRVRICIPAVNPIELITYFNCSMILGGEFRGLSIAFPTYSTTIKYLCKLLTQRSI